ncbi:DciA family protein [Kitasatospora sp. NPDC058444]|uniref:DciA family protein n=1 Tax=Kitasatospora sp. NPDC058444 TaxID=3346504 RepID=UPI0036624383
MTSTPGQAPTGADLARTALRAARHSARLNGNAPAKKTPMTRQQIARAGRDAREPSAIAAVLPAMASAHGWALGTAQGTMRDNWAQLVGPEAALHWYPAGFNTATRTLRVTCDSPAWATKLRLEQRAILAKLNDARPDTVRSLEIRVSATPQAPDAGQGTVPSQPQADPAHTPQGPPVADNPLYRQLRQRMRDQAVIRQTALEEATAERDANLEKWFLGHCGWLREPEDVHQRVLEKALATDNTEHARQQRERHQAALAVARASRSGAIPLHTARPAWPRTGAA